MKIVRHVAPDMRQALRSIRAQLGEDAVILSSRRVPEGVEVTAAVDFDASALQDTMSNPAATLTAAPLPPTSAPVIDTRALVPARGAVAPAPVAAPAGPGLSYSQLAGDAAAQSHAAASHYFPTQPVSEAARPFAHILGSDPAPARTPQAYATPHAAAVVQAPAVQHAPPAPAVAAPAAARVVPTRREPVLNIAPASRQETDVDTVVRLSAAATADRKSTRLNSSHGIGSRMPSSA